MLNEYFSIPMPSLGGHPVAFSSDGRVLLAGNSDGQVTILRATRGEPKRLIDELIALCDDGVAEVRGNAASAFAPLGRAARKAIPVLKRLVEKDEDKNVRLAAMASLVRTGWRETETGNPPGNPESHQ
jgi:hypothetical protein